MESEQNQNTSNNEKDQDQDKENTDNSSEKSTKPKKGKKTSKKETEVEVVDLAAISELLKTMSKKIAPQYCTGANTITFDSDKALFDPKIINLLKNIPDGAIFKNVLDNLKKWNCNRIHFQLICEICQVHYKAAGKQIADYISLLKNVKEDTHDMAKQFCQNLGDYLEKNFQKIIEEKKRNYSKSKNSQSEVGATVVPPAGFAVPQNQPNEEEILELAKKVRDVSGNPFTALKNNNEIHGDQNHEIENSNDSSNPSQIRNQHETIDIDDQNSLNNQNDKNESEIIKNKEEHEVEQKTNPGQPKNDETKMNTNNSISNGFVPFVEYSKLLQENQKLKDEVSSQAASIIQLKQRINVFENAKETQEALETTKFMSDIRKMVHEHENAMKKKNNNKSNSEKKAPQIIVKKNGKETFISVPYETFQTITDTPNMTQVMQPLMELVGLDLENGCQPKGNKTNKELIEWDKDTLDAICEYAVSNATECNKRKDNTTARDYRECCGRLATTERSKVKQEPIRNDDKKEPIRNNGKKEQQKSNKPQNKVSKLIIDLDEDAKNNDKKVSTKTGNPNDATSNISNNIINQVNQENNNKQNNQTNVMNQVNQSNNNEIMNNNNNNEKEDDITTVENQANCSRAVAILALNSKNNDVVQSILFLVQNGDKIAMVKKNANCASEVALEFLLNNNMDPVKASVQILLQKNNK